MRQRTLAMAASALAAACIALAASGIDRPATDRTKIERGREIYNFRCYFCHGYSGDARTLAATLLATRPCDFQSTSAAKLPLGHIERAVREGVPGTSMQSFRGILGEADIAAVAAFVHDEFLERHAPNTRYHTAANGWPHHERYREAYGFARGDIALDTPDSALDEGQRRGKRLFLATCITCHDRAHVRDPGPAWQPVERLLGRER